MKKTSVYRLLLLGTAMPFACMAAAQAQETTNAATGTSTPVPQTSKKLEEITVTAERRTQNLQKVPATIAVVSGAQIQAQGKNTTAEILEDVPNLVVGGATYADNPNGNITIRGVLTTQFTAGTAPPSTTATYVDDVYQGIGGDFDINRVEVLYGPQGTLYGRSATGGVVAFHTNDPVLNKVTGQIQGEAGTTGLGQLIAAVNVPILPTVAVRVAVRGYTQDGYYPNADAGETREHEERVKVLFQPLPNLSFIAALTYNESYAKSGGYNTVLSSTDPNQILYTGGPFLPVGSFVESENRQQSFTTKWDFGLGTLTYVAAFHNYQTSVATALHSQMGLTIADTPATPLDETHTEEVRIASHPGSPLTWLIGGLFYNNQVKSTDSAIQESALERAGGIPDPNPNTIDAVEHLSSSHQRVLDYGVFTEETYSVLPNLRLTGGIRGDYSKVTQSAFNGDNQNTDSFGNYLNPDDLSVGHLTDVEIFRNFTYKARVEYDITPTNMVYATTATGFLPGEQQLATVNGPNNTIAYTVTQLAQERLSSYEIGSKNRFLNNTLQVNGDLYFQHYTGYQLVAQTSSHPPPIFNLLTIPLHIAGVELNAQWQFTPNDNASFSGGITDDETVGNPYNKQIGGYTKDFLALSRLPGVVPYQFTAGYAHTFYFPNGSSLVAHGQARFYGAYEVADLDATEQAEGERAYLHQAATVVGDLNIDWNSPAGKYSVGGYIRNLSNNRFKSTVTPSDQGLTDLVVGVTNPRVFGLTASAKF